MLSSCIILNYGQLSAPRSPFTILSPTERGQRERDNRPFNFYVQDAAMTVPQLELTFNSPIIRGSSELSFVLYSVSTCAKFITECVLRTVGTIMLLRIMSYTDT